MQQRLRHTWEVEKELASTPSDMQKAMDFTMAQMRETYPEDLLTNPVHPLIPEKYSDKTEEIRKNQELMYTLKLAHQAIEDAQYRTASAILYLIMDLLEESYADQ